MIEVGSRILFKFEGNFYKGVILNSVVMANNTYSYKVHVFNTANSYKMHISDDRKLINSEFLVFESEIEETLIEKAPHFKDIDGRSESWMCDVYPNIRVIWNTLTDKQKILIAWDFKDEEFVGE